MPSPTRATTIAHTVILRLPLEGGSTHNINPYKSTKGQQQETSRSSPTTTFKFLSNDVQASDSRTTNSSPSTRGQGNQHIILDDSKGRRYIRTSTTTQQLTSLEVLESFSKALQPHERSPANVRETNRFPELHCPTSREEKRIHYQQQVLNSPRERDTPESYDPVLASTHYHEAAASIDLSNTLRTTHGRRRKSQIDRGTHHAKKGVSGTGSSIKPVPQRLRCEMH